MLLNLFRKYHYFATVELDNPEYKSESTVEDSLVSQKVEELRKQHKYRDYLAALSKNKPVDFNFNLINKYVYKTIQTFFWRRNRKIEYLEPYTTKNYLTTFVIFGSAKASRTINRNCFIFLLELYAHMENPDLRVSSEFECKLKKTGDATVSFYKVKKNRKY